MPNPIMIPADPSANLAKGFANIADVFAPPSARDAYYGTEAGLARAKTQAEAAKALRLSDLWSARDSMTPEQFDRAAAATGLNPVTQGYAKLDVDKRGQDITSGDSRFRTTTEANTSVANNKATNERELIAAISGPTPEGSSRVIPPEVAARLGVPSQQTGIVKLNPGQTATLPPGPAGAGGPADAGVPAPTVLQGNPQMPTKEQVEGRIIAGLSPEEQRAVGLSAVKDRPVYDYSGGTAQVDPVKGTLNNTQDKTPLPVGAKATNLSAPKTSVNVGDNGASYGTPPAGMAWAHSPDGTIKVDERGAPVALTIAGSPLADKQAQTANKQGETEKQRAQSGGIITQDIDRALAAIESDPTLTTGVGSQITSGIGGSPARNLKGLIDTVKTNVGFDKLQQMRASSPTGGALGQVSDKENVMLQSVLGSLDQAQSPEQLKQNLKRVKDVTLDIVHGPGQGPARSHEPTATLGGRKIIARGNRWVDEATGLPVGTEPAP